MNTEVESSMIEVFDPFTNDMVMCQGEFVVEYDNGHIDNVYIQSLQNEQDIELTEQLSQKALDIVVNNFIESENKYRLAL